MSYQSKWVKCIGSAVAGLALALSAQSLVADNGAGDSAAEDPAIPNAGFDELHVNIGADFTRYQTVLIEDPSISFIPRWANTHRNVVNRREIARLERGIADDLKAELVEKLSADGRYRIVEEAEVDTLVIRPEIIDLNVAAPGSRNVQLVDSAGYATLSLEMVDAFSDLPALRILDWKRAQGFSGRDYFMASRANNAREFRLMMAAWAERVRLQLDLLSASEQEEALTP
ncbi:DUF3313 family protein [Marinimicrobium alkaliphilum]|uniref:DUF3313 family protein n=1 Tax=Marinimicrobium alkaliphilum TaxID=2202654 RepID=UPI000DBA57EE|nr:DUF3313 family protein [Marinimicrobium alkaliphilum]